MLESKPCKVGKFVLVQCRTKGVRGALYCGRGRYGEVQAVGQYGWLGNPVRIGSACPECGGIHDTAASTLPCYEEYLLTRLDSDAEFAATFDAALDDNNVLSCFCRDTDCHTRIMTEAWTARNGG